MEGLPAGRLIDSGVGIVDVCTHVANMAKQVSGRVLRSGPADMAANAAEDRRPHVFCISFDR